MHDAIIKTLIVLVGLVATLVYEAHLQRQMRRARERREQYRRLTVTKPYLPGK